MEMFWYINLFKNGDLLTEKLIWREELLDKMDYICRCKIFREASIRQRGGWSTSREP